MWALIILMVMLHIGKLKIVTVDTIQPREFLSWTSINSYIIHKYIHKTPALPAKVFVIHLPSTSPMAAFARFSSSHSDGFYFIWMQPATAQNTWYNAHVLKKNVNTLRFCHEELPKKAQNNILGTPLVFFINRVYI